MAMDYFCGSGGSGSGLIEAVEAAGMKPRGTFINHWDDAINTHAANHPDHRHYNCGVEELDLGKLFPGKPEIDFLWASPSCVFYSRARGDKPVKDQQRASAFCVVEFVRRFRPAAGAIENVPEFSLWTRLRQKNDKETGRRVWIHADTYKKVPPEEVPPKRKGESRKEHRARLAALGIEPSMEPMSLRKGEVFEKWRRRLMREGYDFEYRMIFCYAYGDPTIRRRFFARFVRKDSGLKIVWPDPTHARPGEDGVPGGLSPRRTAREIIDWDNPGNSIFTRPRPLAKNTRRRIAVGLARYGLEGLAGAIESFILPQQQGGRAAKSVDEPVSPLTTAGAEALVNPSLEEIGFPVPAKGSGARGPDAPVRTVTCESRGERLVVPAIIRLKGNSDAEDPDRLNHNSLSG